MLSNMQNADKFLEQNGNLIKLMDIYAEYSDMLVKMGFGWPPRGGGFGNLCETLIYKIKSKEDPRPTLKDLYAVTSKELANLFEHGSSDGTCCGYVFKPGELVYHCSDCAVDSTCVFCAKCFKASDHKGHSVKYMPSGGGGICDCGDPEAWDPEHFCDKHRAKKGESNPLADVPEHIIEAVTEMVHAVSGALATYVQRVHSSFVDPLNAKMEFSPSDIIVVRIHNDDIHTYSQVQNVVVSIKDCNSTKARELTTEVDKLGSLVVFKGSYEEAVRQNVVNNGENERVVPPPDSTSRYEKINEPTTLMKSGLLYSVRSETLNAREMFARECIEFLDALSQGSAWTRRVVSNAMATHLVMRDASEIALSLNGPCKPSYEPKPSEETGVRGEKRKAIAMMEDSDDMLSSGRKPMDLDNDVNNASADVEDTNYAGESKATQSLTATSFEPVFPGVDGIVVGGAGATLLQFLMAETVYLPKQMCEAIQALYTRLLLDFEVFKPHFGETYVRQFPWMSWNYSMGSGTEDLSIQHLSVQILTTPSICHNMMDRNFMFARLLAGLQLSLCVAAAKIVEPKDMDNIKQLRGHKCEVDLIDSSTLNHNRYYHLAFDLQYTLRNVIDGLSGGERFIRDSPAFLAAWIAVLAFWSGRVPFIRKTGDHVQQESREWMKVFDIFMFTKRLQSVIALAVTACEFGPSDTFSREHRSKKTKPLPSSSAELERDESALISLRRRAYDHYTIIKRSLGDAGHRKHAFEVSDAPINAIEELEYFMEAALLGTDNAVMLNHHVSSTHQWFYGRIAALQCVNAIAAIYFDGRQHPVPIEVVSCPMGKFPIFIYEIAATEQSKSAAKRSKSGGYRPYQSGVAAHNAVHRFLALMLEHHETMCDFVSKESYSAGSWLFGHTRMALRHSRRSWANMTSKMQRDMRNLTGPIRHIPHSGETGSKGKGMNAGVEKTLDWKLRMSLAEAPLRTSSLFAQIRAGMWRKNGQLLQYMADVYVRQALDSTFALDVKALQIGACAVGPDHFLMMLLEKFGVLPWLFGENEVGGVVANDVTRDSNASVSKKLRRKSVRTFEFVSSMMEQALRMIIVMQGELPKRLRLHATDNTNHEATPHSMSVVKATKSIRRKVLHFLLVEPCPNSKLATLAKREVGELQEHISPSTLLRSVMREVAEKPKVDAAALRAGGQLLFELKKDLYDEYDPYFIGLSTQQHFSAKEHWLDYRQETRKSLESYSSHRPTAPKPPIPVPFYQPVLRMFVIPEYICMMSALLRKAVAADKVTAPGQNTTSKPSKDAKQMAKLWTSSLRAAVFHALSVSCHVLNMLNDRNGGMNGEGKGSLSESGSIINFLSGICLKDIQQQLTFPSAVMEGSVLDCVVQCVKSLEAEGVGADIAGETKNGDKVEPGSHRRAKSKDAEREQDLEGLSWILEQWRQLDDGFLGSGIVRSFIETARQDMMASSMAGVQKAKADRVGRKNMQKVAMEKLAEQQRKFAAMMSMDLDDSSSDDESVKAASGESSSSSGEDSDEDAVMGESSANLNERPSPSRAVSLPEDVGEDVVCILCREGPTASATSAGASSKTTEKGPFGFIAFSQVDPLASVNENSPPTCKPMPFIQFCSHGCHRGCLDAYCRTFRMRRRLTTASIDTDVEFMCPLCKSLSNCHVPMAHADLSTERINTPEKLTLSQLRKAAVMVSSINESDSASATPRSQSNTERRHDFSELNKLSVKQLKLKLDQAGVSHKTCIEKRDLVAKLKGHMMLSAGATKESGSSDSKNHNNNASKSNLFGEKSDVEVRYSSSLANVHHLSVSLQTLIEGSRANNQNMNEQNERNRAVPEEIRILWQACVRTIHRVANVPFRNINRYVPALRALLGCARLSTQLINDKKYVREHVLISLSKAIESGRIVPYPKDDTVDGDILEEILFSGEVSYGSGTQSLNEAIGSAEQQALGAANGIKESKQNLVSSAIDRVWSLVGVQSDGDGGAIMASASLNPVNVLTLLVIFLPKRVDVLRVFRFMWLAQLERSGFLQSTNCDLSGVNDDPWHEQILSRLLVAETSLHESVDCSTDYGSSALISSSQKPIQAVLHFLRCSFLIMKSLKILPLANSNAGSEIGLLVECLGLGDTLTCSEDINHVLHSWRAPFTDKEKQLLTQHLTSSLRLPMKEPFLLSMCRQDHSYSRFEAVMEEAQQWFFEGTQRKKQELSNMETTMKSMSASEALENETPAMCLLCGCFLRAAEKFPADSGGIGACHRHVGMCRRSPAPATFNPLWKKDSLLEGFTCCPTGGKSGIGIFLMVNRTSILLVRKGWSCYWPSIYVDEYGEEDVNMSRGMPLQLSKSRAEALWQLYESGGVSDAVVQKRNSMDRVLKENWY